MNDKEPTAIPESLPVGTPCLGGRFELMEPIGAGGGAIVVKARDRQLSHNHQLSQYVAVKLLRTRDDDLRRRFVHESRVLAGLDHPSIVRVVGHGAEGETLYTALELIEGKDLAEQPGPWPWRQAVEIGTQIASALDATHRQGLVHRDVKPANIMIAGYEPLRVKLIDFGVVRSARADKVPTENGKALGTPGYMPLEAGLALPNPSFDVYALGATLYQLLTGKLPVPPLQPLRVAHPGCDGPDDLDRVLAAALALEPEDRTQSAAELGRALAAVLTAHPERGAAAERIDGRYERLGLAGTGAKGEAVKAVHRGTGHDVVLKFLRSRTPDDVLRFEREAKLLATFEHPALPRFYDYAPAADPPYIVMASAAGEPASRLCSPPRLRPTQVAAVGLKLAEVLAVVHARGVLHRDINANNVLIDATGGVTLLDFGSAELTEKFYDVLPGTRRYLTPPEARVKIPDGGIGRLAWSAPEVAAGQDWTEKSDVYSAGYLLFRLLTGKVPERGVDPPSSPQEHANTCPDDLADAVMAALRVDPRTRPSAAKLADMLRDVLETEEEAHARVLAMPPTGRPPLRLVPSSGSPDWTEHPVPEPSEPAAQGLHQPSVSQGTGAPEVASSPASHITAPPAVRRYAWPATVLGVLALGLVLWPMRTPAPAKSVERDVIVDPDPTVLASPPRADPPPPLPHLQDALAAARGKLRDCSRLADGSLVVEFSTLKDRNTFHTVVIQDNANPDLERCVRDATLGLRFQPGDSQILTEEYEP